MWHEMHIIVDNFLLVIIGIIAAVVVVGIVVAVVLGMRRGKSDKTINVGNNTYNNLFLTLHMPPPVSIYDYNYSTFNYVLKDIWNKMS